MKKYIKATITTSAIVGLFGIGSVLAAETEVETVDTVSEEAQVQSVIITPIGTGHINWRNGNDSYATSFNVSVDGEATFSRLHTPKFVFDDEAIHDMLVEAVEKEFEENKRAIYVMTGDMDDDNQGMVTWFSSEREYGETRFVLEDDGEIVFNESDWNALPETDEYTVDDFEASAEVTVNVVNRRRELESSE